MALAATAGSVILNLDSAASALAGIAIRLSVKVESVREASVPEIGKGTLGTGFFKLETTHNGSDTPH